MQMVSSNAIHMLSIYHHKQSEGMTEYLTWN